MPFQLSPGVAVVEKDFTSIVPAVATSIGAFAGQFDWGPVLEPITITSEDELVRRFGTPNNAALARCPPCGPRASGRPPWVPPRGRCGQMQSCWSRTTPVTSTAWC